MDEPATGRRDASPPPLRLPLPPEDLLLEILLRLPPEPIYLFRASLVSKRWRCLVHDARFLARFRELHGGSPPLLGFFDNLGPRLFVPTTGAFAFSTSTMSHHNWWAWDCRHGRALLERPGNLVVWDLVTGDKRYLPPIQTDDGDYNVAVVCAAHHQHHHGDCRSFPFLVVFVSSHETQFITSARVYSSETGVWGDIISIATPDSLVTTRPTALVGNTLYFLCGGYHIVEFDLDNHSLGIIEEMPYDALYSYSCPIVIMPAEDGQQLGFAGIEGFNLHLWSRVPGIDGVTTWTHRRVINLECFLAPEVVARCHMDPLNPLEPIGFAEDADVIFFHVGPTVYMINIKSMQFEEVLEKGRWSDILPYTSFYAPGVTIGGEDDQAELSDTI